jgi:hypothetical protein
MPKAGQKTQFYAANQVARRNKASKRCFMSKCGGPMSRPEHERQMNGGFKMRTGKVA